MDTGDCNVGILSLIYFHEGCNVDTVNLFTRAVMRADISPKTIQPITIEHVATPTYPMAVLEVRVSSLAVVVLRLGTTWTYLIGCDQLIRTKWTYLIGCDKLIRKTWTYLIDCVQLIRKTLTYFIGYF